MGAVAVGFGMAVQTLLSPPFPPGRAAFGVARPEPPTHTGNPTMNDNHHNQPESVEERIARLEIQKIRLETELIEASMRRDRVRLVLDIVKWTVITAAVVFAFIAADRLGWF